jgi:hypothetical protein
VGSMNAAPCIGLGDIDPFAAIPEDARVPRRQPGEVGAEELLIVGGVGELDPVAGKCQGDLRHADTLRIVGVA